MITILNMTIYLNAFAEWQKILSKPYGRIVLIGGIVMLLGSLLFSKKKK